MLFYPMMLLGSVIFLDICLSGDNAVVIAMAANNVKAELRDAAIFLGLGLAAILRIVLAFGATVLLQQYWISLLGGFALLWVAYKLFQDLRSQEDSPDGDTIKSPSSLWMSLGTIVVADLSMSLDNVLAVASLARNHAFIMMLGILASIFILLFISRHVANLLRRYRWLNWIALVMIVYVAVDLISGSYKSALIQMRF